jgi:hypothetical protein
MRTLLALALASTFVVAATVAIPSSASATNNMVLQGQAGEAAIPHRRGADNPAGDQRRGRGRDNPAGHRVTTDGEPTLVARRGADNPAGDQRRGRGKDNPAGHRVAPESIDTFDNIVAAGRSTLA